VKWPFRSSQQPGQHFGGTAELLKCAFTLPFKYAKLRVAAMPWRRGVPARAAQDGPNNGSPVITITPRASGSTGTNKRIQLIHSVDGASTGKGTIVDNVPLADFEDQWVKVREEVPYAHDGYYSCKITRSSDGKVLVDFADPNIDMWRIGSSYIRSKFGWRPARCNACRPESAAEERVDLDQRLQDLREESKRRAGSAPRVILVLTDVGRGLQSL
jgi:hypothetical protein